MKNTYITILEQAKHLIDTEYESFICLALRDVGSKNPKLEARCKRIKRYITRSLGMYYTLEHWLSDEKKIKNSEITDSRMREYRLRYIDHLINIYKDVK